jgi:DNA-binding transcriptional LysR family regulator
VPITPITDLEIFARVAAAGNMSAAGREMGLSPAVVSKRLSHMEERLGARLFQRTTRQLKLTETGEGFYKRVVGILRDIDEAEAFVSQVSGRVAGMLRITAPIGFARRHIGPFLPPFMRQYPDLSVEVALRDDIVDIVGESFDIAIRIAELDDSSLVARKLAPCRRVICATPDYIERNGEPKTLGELSKHSCLSLGYQHVWRVVGPEGPATMKIAPKLRCSSGDVLHEAHMSGMGIAMRSTWAISEELKSGRLKLVLPQYREAPGVAIYAVYPCRQFVPAKLKLFIDYLAQQFGPTPYWDRGLDLDGDRRHIVAIDPMRAALK